MTQHIRKAEESDIPRLQEIRGSVRENILSDPSKVTREDYIWFIHHGPVWVCEAGGDIKGFSAGDPRDGSIWALFVDPSYESRGIGRLLYQQACQSLIDAGHTRLSLNTQADSRAERFYKADGWVEDGFSSNGDRNFFKNFEPF